MTLKTNRHWPFFVVKQKTVTMTNQPNETGQGLSNLQQELLKLYANNISEENLYEIKQLLTNYFAEKATQAMDKVWEEKGLTPQDMIDWTNEHHRRKSSH